MSRAWAAAVVALGFGCGSPTPRITGSDVREARDRPPVVVIARGGDPSSALSVSVATGDDPEAAVAIAALLESRLEGARVTPSWDGVRATFLVSSPDAARAATLAIRGALTSPAREEELAPAKRKLAALAARRLGDASLAAWARCTGSLYAMPGKAPEIALPKLEGLRAALGTGRVAFAVVGAKDVGEAVASAILDGPAWRSGAPFEPPRRHAEAAAFSVFDAPADAPLAQTTLYLALDVGSSGTAVTTAETLGDPHGPLRARLEMLDLPFVLREVVGAAHPTGGCVGVVLEARPAAERTDLAARAADAVALVDIEAGLAEGAATLDGATLSRRAGDAREASERASWWALADRTKSAATSVTLALPTRRGAGERAKEPKADTLREATVTARAAWRKPVVSGKVRVESGQGELWLLLASPCGTELEGDNDAGVTALAVAALHAGLPDAEVFVAPDGAGLVLHGPPLAGESPAAHAQRLGDRLGRAIAGPPDLAQIAHARGELPYRDDPAFATLAAALSPGHPSWVSPWGTSEGAMRISDGAIRVRADALRAGPLRLAILASTDRAQGDAALRAADRWLDRRGDAARTCPSLPNAGTSRPGTYAVETRPGQLPEAILAFPFAIENEPSARAIASGIDGDGGPLARALGDLARSSSVRVLGLPHAPALTVRITSSQANLDAAVLQGRALIDRLQKSGLTPADLDRAVAAQTAAQLDPRARLVATWRGDDGRKPASLDEVRAFATRALGEDQLVVVAARPPRPKP